MIHKGRCSLWKSDNYDEFLEIIFATTWMFLVEDKTRSQFFGHLVVYTSTWKTNDVLASLSFQATPVPDIKSTKTLEQIYSDVPHGRHSARILLTT